MTIDALKQARRLNVPNSRVIWVASALCYALSAVGQFILHSDFAGGFGMGAAFVLALLAVKLK